MNINIDEISPVKKEFLKSIGIDLNNIPSAFFKENKSFDSEVTKMSERSFLHSERVSGIGFKQFSLKDLAGTMHPDYENMPWLEAFLKTKRGDQNIKEYFSNPQYYEQLKEINQADMKHNTPLELYDVDGKYFISGGNNRLALMMLKYLAEKSNAKTQEQADEIDKKYTFAAKVNKLPHDRKIVETIDILQYSSAAIGKSFEVVNVGKDVDDCNFEIIASNKESQTKIFKISGYNELEKFFKAQYSLFNSTNEGDMFKKIDNIAKLYGQNTKNSPSYSEERAEVLKTAFPDIDKLMQSYSAARAADPSCNIAGTINNYINNLSLQA